MYVGDILKKKILSYSDKLILRYNPSITDEQVEIINYGLESIYLTFTKLIIIICLSFILGITYKILIILLFYNIIRITSFGLHASKSIYCLLASVLFLIGGVYLCDFIHLNFFIKVILCFFCIICIYLYAPADTHKRPLVNKKKRLIYKTISLINAGIFSIFIVMYNESIISNYLLYSMIVAVNMILPFTYKVFNMPYNNYKNYEYGLINY